MPTSLYPLSLTHPPPFEFLLFGPDGSWGHLPCWEHGGGVSEAVGNVTALMPPAYGSLSGPRSDTGRMHGGSQWMGALRSPGCGNDTASHCVTLGEPCPCLDFPVPKLEWGAEGAASLLHCTSGPCENAVTCGALCWLSLETSRGVPSPGRWWQWG